MRNMSSYSTKNIIIIISMFFVFSAVIIVFYTEIVKNNKIRNSKKNFEIVKEELTKELNKCKANEQSWLFGISCEQKPTKKIISDYFNKNRKLTNPYDGYEGVEGNPGSVQIDIEDQLFNLSVDVEANGGIDIQYKIYF